MTPVNQTRNVTGGVDTMGAIHVLLAIKDTQKKSENPRQAMDEIEARATKVSSVLEKILHEPHGEPRWGLNE